MSDEKKLKLLVFSSKQCSACQFMKKRKVVELFKKDNESVEVEEIDTDTDEGSDRADAYNVMSLPTLVFEYTAAPGAELVREEGAVTLQQLGALHMRALAKGAGRKATRSGK